ncbi:PilW family type IVa pilus biogenesis/stability lipoprotein TapF [Cocleimonas flava]|uniref:Type IV pilus assembly protein PilF n=1 Tax=Cocleimonas flava TaxID=634765 RepID=A0A4R1ETW3_9GAMM|nr:type IV pilus biogenesis/stability protein PilW [Cocleimonas flava]TCJ85096.1 type IV pilus assembly protein PilF [Cocleimonas flava]
MSTIYSSGITDIKASVNNVNSFNLIKTKTLLTSAFIASALFLSACSSITVKSSEASNYNSDLGIRYLQKGRLNLANEKLLKALEQNPNSAQSNHYYAILQQKLGNTKKAETYFLKAVNISPKNPEIRNNYGSFLCDSGRPQAAIKQFNVAINDPLYRTPEFAYTNAGICLRKTNNDAKAETYFRQALKKKSAFPSALLEMAKLYSDRGNYPRAQAFMLRYESVGHSSPEALELCSKINTKMGDHAKAGKCKAALLRLFPASKEAQQAN